MKIKLSQKKIKLLMVFFIILFIASVSSATIAGINNTMNQHTGLTEYTVGNIDIVIKSSSAAKAKEIAIKSAKRKAYLRLITMLSIDSSLFDKSKTSNRDIESTVLDVSISDEQFGDKKYKGIFMVRFDKERLFNLLKRYNVNTDDINLNSTKISSMLIIPVLQIDDNAYIWDENNSWKLYWDRNYEKIFSPMAPITLASGDLSDIAIANSDKILNKDINSLNLLMNKYLTDAILIAHIRNIAGKKKLYLTLFDGINYHEIPHKYINESISNIDFFQKASLKSINAVESFLIKEQYNNSKGQINKKLELSFDANNISEFIRFEKTLKMISGIKSFKLKQLNKSNAMFTIDVNGTFESLAKDMKDYGFKAEKSYIDSQKVFITNNNNHL